ncbi:MAG: DNA mismatch repair endonuclease MutL [Vallitalea sp.]|jgi:DNA mismatch repair protein MutL|nr:DNA mismatch repair endonuclease MutL [Vallitalea sp.]
MPEIKLLDQSTINKIAAGEVVERPASVVKELVENSIDASASAITVEIKEGGISFIRITDNGIGISKEDINTAFIRHSTSKIKSIEDLFTVSSLGFRGEALASIAAVSQVEVITKTYDDITGIRYVIEGGKEISIEEIGCPEGTTIIIRNIFYNTPARRKFLKKPATEGSYISELINKLALGNMGISFKFIYNNAIKLHTSGNNVLKDCVFNVYGKDIVKNIVPIKINNSEFTIDGYIGKPQICRANRNYENYYINGRYIKSKLIMKAIEDGYKTRLTVHKYPFAVFNININQDLIDVNVHPTKMEVRFNNEKLIYDCISEGINDALNKIDLIPEVGFNKTKASDKRKDIISKSIPEPFEKNRIEANKVSNVREVDNNYNAKVISPTYEINKTFRSNNKFNSSTIDNNISKGYIDENNRDGINSNEEKNIIESKEEIKKSLVNKLSDTLVSDKKILKGEQIEILDNKFIDRKTVKNHKIIGQLFNTYWIIELENKFYMIDQHAAHERVLYERILNKLNNSDSEAMSQGLLQPIIVHVSIKEKQLITEYKQVFNDIGFEIEEFGKDAYAIRSVPYIFAKSMSAEQFIEMLDKLDDKYDNKKYDIILNDIATMACKAAVKAHDKMSIKEYEKLLDELLELENPYTCPHGRPTIISMTRYELEKKFKRIQ